eukprot:1631543-Pleurochrysis_carterae.AAC.1
MGAAAPRRQAEAAAVFRRAGTARASETRAPLGRVCARARERAGACVFGNLVAQGRAFQRVDARA